MRFSPKIFFLSADRDVDAGVLVVATDDTFIVKVIVEGSHIK
jgi:hypothetical protein